MKKIFITSCISCLDDYFYDFKKMSKVSINNPYIYEKTCGSPSKTRKGKISHILETSPTHATE